MRIRSLAVAGTLAASLLAGQAHAATTYTWDTTGAFSNSNGSMVFSSAQDANEKVKLRAYQISTLSAGGSFTTATLSQYPGGLGITSTNETLQSPNHAIDNDTSSGRYEFLLVEFDSANYKDMGFRIGWKGTDSDVQVWVGNAAAGLNLTNAAVCGASCDFTELGALGFTTTQNFDNVPLATTQTVAGQITGRYLLIAGRLQNNDSWKDYFKVSLLAGTESTSVPEPSSLMIMAVAAAGVGLARRKRRDA